MKYLHAIFVTTLATAATAFAAEVDLSKLPPAAAKLGVTFDKDIHPLFEASCVRCHSGERPKAGLRLDTAENVLKGSKDGKVVVVGDSAKSPLVIAVSQLDPHSAMPPKPRGPRPGGPGAPGAPGQNPPPGGQQPPPGAPGAGAPRGNMPPPPKPLTPAEVGLVRAWIDQGAK